MYSYAEGLVVEGSEGGVHIVGGLRVKDRHMVLIIYLLQHLFVMDFWLVLAGKATSKLELSRSSSSKRRSTLAASVPAEKPHVKTATAQGSSARRQARALVNGPEDTATAKGISTRQPRAAASPPAKPQPDASKPARTQTAAQTDLATPAELQTDSRTDAAEPAGLRTDSQTDNLQPAGPQNEAQTDTIKPIGPQTEAQTDNLKPAGPQTGAQTDTIKPIGPQTEAQADIMKPAGPQTGAQTDTIKPTGPQTEAQADIMKPAGPHIPARAQRDTMEPVGPQTEAQTDITEPAGPHIKAQAHRDMAEPPAGPHTEAQTDITKPAGPHIEAQAHRDMVEPPAGPQTEAQTQPQTDRLEPSVSSSEILERNSGGDRRLPTQPMLVSADISLGDGLQAETPSVQHPLRDQQGAQTAAFPIPRQPVNPGLGPQAIAQSDAQVGVSDSQIMRQHVPAMTDSQLSSEPTPPAAQLEPQSPDLSSPQLASQSSPLLVMAQHANQPSPQLLNPHLISQTSPQAASLIGIEPNPQMLGHDQQNSPQHVSPSSSKRVLKKNRPKATAQPSATEQPAMQAQASAKPATSNRQELPAQKQELLIDGQEVPVSGQEMPFAEVPVGQAPMAAQQALKGMTRTRSGKDGPAMGVEVMHSAQTLSQHSDPAGPSSAQKASPAATANVDANHQASLENAVGTEIQRPSTAVDEAAASTDAPAPAAPAPVPGNAPATVPIPVSKLPNTTQGKQLPAQVNLRATDLEPRNADHAVGPVPSLFPNPVPKVAQSPQNTNRAVRPVPSPVLEAIPRVMLVPKVVPKPVSTPGADAASVPSAVPNAVPSTVPSAVPSTVPRTIPSAVPRGNPSAVPRPARSTVPNPVLTMAQAFDESPSRDALLKHFGAMSNRLNPVIQTLQMKMSDPVAKEGLQNIQDMLQGKPALPSASAAASAGYYSSDDDDDDDSSDWDSYSDAESAPGPSPAHIALHSCHPPVPPQLHTHARTSASSTQPHSAAQRGIGQTRTGPRTHPDQSPSLPKQAWKSANQLHRHVSTSLAQPPPARHAVPGQKSAVPSRKVTAALPQQATAPLLKNVLQSAAGVAEQAGSAPGPWLAAAAVSEQAATVDPQQATAALPKQATATVPEEAAHVLLLARLSTRAMQRRNGNLESSMLPQQPLPDEAMSESRAVKGKMKRKEGACLNSESLAPGTC